MRGSAEIPLPFEECNILEGRIGPTHVGVIHVGCIVVEHKYSHEPDFGSFVERYKETDLYGLREITLPIANFTAWHKRICCGGFHNVPDQLAERIQIKLKFTNSTLNGHPIEGDFLRESLNGNALIYAKEEEPPLKRTRFVQWQVPAERFPEFAQVFSNVLLAWYVELLMQQWVRGEWRVVTFATIRAFRYICRATYYLPQFTEFFFRAARYMRNTRCRISYPRFAVLTVEKVIASAVNGTSAARLYDIMAKGPEMNMVRLAYTPQQFLNDALEFVTGARQKICVCIHVRQNHSTFDLVCDGIVVHRKLEEEDFKSKSWMAHKFWTWVGDMLRAFDLYGLGSNGAGPVAFERFRSVDYMFRTKNVPAGRPRLTARLAKLAKLLDSERVGILIEQ